MSTEPSTRNRTVALQQVAVHTLSMLAYAYLAVTAATDPKAAATWSASAQHRSAVSWYT
jgi:hypothetical protein